MEMAIWFGLMANATSVSSLKTSDMARAGLFGKMADSTKAAGFTVNSQALATI